MSREFRFWREQMEEYNRPDVLGEAMSEELKFTPATPSYNISFHRDGGEKMGELDFNGPEMKFTGNAEESAKVFFKWIADSFAQRLKEERESLRQESGGKMKKTSELFSREVYSGLVRADTYQALYDHAVALEASLLPEGRFVPIGHLLKNEYGFVSAHVPHLADLQVGQTDIYKCEPQEGS